MEFRQSSRLDDNQLWESDRLFDVRGLENAEILANVVKATFPN
jgi:hypothetical protein